MDSSSYVCVSGDSEGVPVVVAGNKMSSRDLLASVQGLLQTTDRSCSEYVRSLLASPGS